MKTIKTTTGLNEALTDLLLKVQDGSIPLESARVAIGIADKINKNNLNAITYKRMTNAIQPIAFFSEIQ